MSLLIAYSITLLLARLSYFLLPASIQPVNRPKQARQLQFLFVSALFLTALLITQRPWLSGVISLAILTVFLVVNNAKYKALQEPLVFSDIYLYIQVIRHPRLFLPFLNIPVTIGAIIVGLTLLYLAIKLEPAAAPQHLQTGFYWLGITLLIILLISIRKQALATPLSLQPSADARQQGLYNSLLCYGLQSATPQHKQQLQNTLQTASPFAKPPPQAAQTRRPPNIITIQSESFFDARRLSHAIQTDILQTYDQLQKQAIHKGTLQVPAWGANTLRPEFAFLSGIDNQQLGLYRFNPYHYLHKATPSLASYLKAQGYRCIAVHPNSSAFFKRNQAFPLLGFDEFIDSADFDQTMTAGPYISDHAVGEKIKQLLDQQQEDQPLFIFAITMENHGPLHLESVHEQDIQSLYQNTPPQHHDDLTVYLRHLNNADHMLKSLTDSLYSHPKDNLLCFYGDHVPSMPAVYKELDFTDGRTDYLIWHNRQHNTPQPATPPEPLPIHQLGRQLLNAAFETTSPTPSTPST